MSHVAHAKEAGHRYIFHALSDKEEERTATYSNWWRRQRKVFGIFSSKKTFHSFRHAFKDACRRAEIEENIHDELTGHANGSTGRYYGTGQPIPVLAKNMAKISYLVEIKRQTDATVVDSDE